MKQLTLAAGSKFLMASLLGLLSSQAWANGIECHDQQGQIHFNAALPATVTFEKEEPNLEIKDAVLHVDRKYTLSGQADLDEPASGGAQWEATAGLIVVRSRGAGHIVVVRVGTWNSEGLAVGRIEEGAAADLLPVTCTFTKDDMQRPSEQSGVGPVFSSIVVKTAASSPYCKTLNDGDICLMTWNDAIQYCKSQKAHLPTAREYANLIQPRGTVILEVAEVHGAPPAGFYLVESRNPDGNLDSFYMNHSAYRRPVGEVGNHLLWTASIPPQHPQYAHVYYDQWGGGGGNPQDHLLDRANAVQCVSGL